MITQTVTVLPPHLFIVETSTGWFWVDEEREESSGPHDTYEDAVHSWLIAESPEPVAA